ncbi:hypothetical protein Q5762_29610 [Streptomyces sp. P9(2023)]|nr:hypothetical protein [Streptomyces sp. P9(2023)]
MGGARHRRTAAGAQLPVPLRRVQPVLRHIRDAPERTEDSVVSVVIPEYVVGHWWEQPLHNQSALRLEARLLFMKERRRHRRPLPARIRPRAGRRAGKAIRDAEK